MQSQVHPEEFVQRLFKLYGGRDKAISVLNRAFEENVARWNQPTGAIGRVLRSHLYVEYHLTRLLEIRNPNLGDVNKARLSFWQKVILIEHTDAGIEHLIIGIKRLNSIRNNMGHKLHSQIAEEDRQPMLSDPLFASLRIALAAPQNPSDDVVDIIEEFAKFAGGWLRNTIDPHRDLWYASLSGDDSDTSPRD